MDEFVEHYMSQGVDHFYIVNNNSNDAVHEWLEQSKYKDFITLRNDTRDMGFFLSNEGPAGHKQLLDENFYDLVRCETEWVLVVDTDEFMFGKNGYTLRTYLSTLDDAIGCVYVLWNIITPNCVNGKIPDAFSIKTNTKRLDYDILRDLSPNIQHANDFGKSLVRTSMLDDFRKFWLHKIFVNGKTITNYGNEKNEWYDNMNTIDYSEEKYAKLNITLHHYAIRNHADFVKKSKQLDQVPQKRKFILGLFEMLELDDSHFKGT